MAIRFAAASALALAVLVAGPAKAQFLFFGSPSHEYALSPREIVAMLDDEGYSLRGPMMRRGGVYVCNAISVSGRQVRLIVDARNGHIVQRYAVRGDGFEDGERSAAVRPPRDIGRDDGDEFDTAFPRRRQALDDPSAPLRRDDAAPSRGDDFGAPSDAPKPKRHTAKKHAAPAALAKAPATPLTPDAVPAPKPEPAPTTAAVAPSAPTPELKRPVEEVKPVEVTTPAPVAAAPPAPAPTPSASPAPPPPPVQARAEPRKIEEPKADTPPAKPEPARKKLNDLPVGTLD